MGQDENSVTLIDEKGTHPLPRLPKKLIAQMLLQHISAMV